MQDEFEIPKISTEPNKRDNKIASMKLNKNLVAFIGIGLLILIVLGFFGFQYIAPFGAKVIYQFTSDKNGDKVSGLLGANKSGAIETNAVNSLIIPQQIIRNDIVTFNLKLLSKKIDGIWVNLKYKGDPGEIKIGVRGSEKEEYQYQPLHNQILNSLSWNQTTSGDTTLWQREKKYKDIADFVGKLPISDQSKVASYFYNPSDNLIKENNLSNPKNLIIESRLRGSHSLFVNVDRMPFILNIKKQDNNAYKGEDTLLIQISKDNKEIIKKEIPDDSVTDTSGLTIVPQKSEIKINNIPLGIYKVILLDESNGADVLITKIETNQQSLVFDSHIFLYNNKPTNLWTNSKLIKIPNINIANAQIAKLDSTSNLDFSQPGQSYEFDLKSIDQKELNKDREIHEININKGFLNINGDGYFAFSEKSFFNPEQGKMVDLSTALDINKIDSIITNYKKVKKQGDWYVAQAYFDPKDIKIDRDKLYFSLEIPGLQSYSGEIFIDNLEVTVDKPGWFNSNPPSGEASEPFGQTQGKQDKGLFTNVRNGITGFFGGIWKSTTNFFKNLWPFGKDQGKLNEVKSSSAGKPTNTPTPTPTLKDKLKISVQNGGGTAGTAAKYADLIKQEGFKNVEATNASNLNYKNATISYSKTEENSLKETINEINKILEKEYKTINKLTNGEKGKILVILGELPKIASPSPTVSPSPTIKP